MTDVVAELKQRIDKTLDDLKKELMKVRTGRASASILDNIRVDYYGTPTPLSGVASVNVPEPRLITIKPWEKSVLKEIEKALREANLGINPMNDGEIIRLPFPPLTEERRKDIAKQVKAKGEDHKVAIRNIRRDANEALKTQLKDKKITEDDQKRFTEKVQKETDNGIAEVDKIISAKDKESMSVCCLPSCSQSPPRPSPPPSASTWRATGGTSSWSPPGRRPCASCASTPRTCW